MSVADFERQKTQAKIRRIRKGEPFSGARETFDYDVYGGRVVPSTPEGAVFLAELASVGAFGAATAAAVRDL